MNISSDVMILSSKKTNLYTKVTNFSNFSQPSLYFPYFHSPPPPKKEKKEKRNLSPKVKNYATNLSSYITIFFTEVTNLSKQLKIFDFEGNEYFHLSKESFRIGNEFCLLDDEYFHKSNEFRPSCKESCF